MLQQKLLSRHCTTAGLYRWVADYGRPWIALGEHTYVNSGKIEILLPVKIWFFLNCSGLEDTCNISMLDQKKIVVTSHCWILITYATLGQVFLLLKDGSGAMVRETKIFYFCWSIQRWQALSQSIYAFNLWVNHSMKNDTQRWWNP